jgi:hypothetical protein
MSTLFMQIQDPPPLEGQPRLPPALVPILRKALAKSPGRRYDSAAEMARALEEARRDPQRAPAEAPAPAAAAAPLPVEAAPGPTEPPAPPGRAETPAPPLAPPPVPSAPASQPPPPERRSETRLETPLTVVLKRLTPSGTTLQEEYTIADNLSRGGARVRRLTISSYKVGDIVGFEEVGGNFRTRATVRNTYLGPDRIPRMGLQFLDSKAPDRLVMTGDWKPSVLRSPAVRAAAQAAAAEPTSTPPPAPGSPTPRTPPPATARPTPTSPRAPAAAAATPGSLPPLASLATPGATDPRQPTATGPAANTDERRRDITARYAEQGRQTHYDVLGVTATARREEVTAAFQRLIRRYHPDTGSDPLLADVRSQMHAIAVRLAEAHDVLSDPQRRAAYEAELSAKRPATLYTRAAVPAAQPELEDLTARAEGALATARQLIAEAKYWDAIQVVEHAIPQTQAGSRLRHALQAQLATAYMANPKWVKRAEEMLQQVVTENPSFTEAILILGRIYKERGLKVRAERMFRRVLEIDPKNATAARELASVV